ncbi:MAG: PIG-L deacetylase family protein [Pseudomonadota bacterium]
MPLSVLFIGAHADDVEIGCGGTLAKLSQSGWITWVCVLTDEREPEAIRVRRREAVEGATACGVRADRVLFLGEADAALTCNGKSVGGLRKLLDKHACNPDLVITHTRADSHGDHRAAHDIVLSTFRRKPIMQFAVVNSLVSSEFDPHIFTDITQFVETKNRALASHSSQSDRIDLDAIAGFAQRFDQDQNKLVEPFELFIQEGAESQEHIAVNLNDDAFHGFWFHQIHLQGITNFYSDAVHRTTSPRWRKSLEREGYGVLLTAFAKRWGNYLAIDEAPAETVKPDLSLIRSHCIISGGSASNPLAEALFNEQTGLRYRTGWSGAERSSLHIFDAVQQVEIVPVHSTDLQVEVDFGILTVTPNPGNLALIVIGCMGIHAYGTKACFMLLSNPALLAQLPACDAFQVLVRYDVKSETVTLVAGSLHEIVRPPAVLASSTLRVAAPVELTAGSVVRL